MCEYEIAVQLRRCIIDMTWETGDFDASPRIFEDSPKDVGGYLKIIGDSPMSLKGLWRPDWTAGSRQCQDCGRCRTRGRGQ